MSISLLKHSSVAGWQLRWNDQVLKESKAERVVRATVAARRTLEAGFTTVRDLGSEGAGYADVGLKTYTLTVIEATKDTLKF